MYHTPEPGHRRPYVFKEDLPSLMIQMTCALLIVLGIQSRSILDIEQQTKLVLKYLVLNWSFHSVPLSILAC